MWWNIIQFLVNLFQVIINYKTFDLFYERRFKFKYSLELIMAVAIVMLSIINFNYSIGTHPYLFLGFYLFLIVVNIIFFKGNPVSKIATFFLIVVIFGASELISASLIHFVTNIDVRTLNEKSFGRLLAIINSQTLIMFAYVIMKKRINKKKMNLNNNIYYFMIGLIMFFTVAIIITVIAMYGKIPDNNTITMYLTILTFLVSLLSLILITLTSKIVNDMEAKHNMDLELQHIKLEQNYFSDVNSALEEIRILRHDTRGELAILHGYNELNQRDKIRNHIEKRLAELDVKLIPKMDNDNIITYLLNFKIKEAQSNNIKTEIQSNLTEEKIIYIDKEEICRVLNNVLNNAIEACKNCDLKYIKLQLNIVNNYIVIKCENSFSGQVHSENGIIQTLKKDKARHGYGLKSINNIVNKYQGSVDVHTQDNVFYIGIFMLNEK